MNCRTFVERMEEYLEGALDADAHDRAAAHLHECADCRRRVERLQTLRAALCNLPVPPPRPGFFEHAIAQAQAEPPPRRRYWIYAAGAALAAGLVLWVGFRWRLNAIPAPAPAGVTITLNETRTIQLSFNAERELPGATLSIRLPDGVELRGFPEQREVRWQTSLVRGVNVLSLPLVAKSTGEGTLLASIQHGDRRTELAIPLRVSDRPHTSAGGPAYAERNRSGVPRARA